MNSFETEWERPDFDSVPSLAENAVYLLPGCDDTILRKTLQVTYRDFCKRSATLRTWRKVVVEPGRGMYAVAPVLSSEIDCVTRVVLCGSLQPLSRGWSVVGDPPMLNLCGIFGGHLIEPGPVVDLHVMLAYEQEASNVGSIPVEGKPLKFPRREPTALWVEAVEVPHMNEERAPRAFLRRHGEAIVDGALARMMSMANRQWADPGEARARGIAYENAISEALVRARNGGAAANGNGGFAVSMSGAI